MDSQNNDKLRAEVLKVFEEMLKNIGVSKYSMSISKGTEAGENFLGIITEVKVNGYTDEGNKIEIDFVIKSTAADGVQRESVFLEDTYKREIFVYSKILPEFEKFQEDKLVFKPFKSYPLYYGSCPKYGQETLILENMKIKEYNVWNRKVPVNLDHVILVVKELGRFHAVSYAMRDQHPELFQYIAKNTHETFFQNFSHDFMRKTSKHRIDEALKALDPINDKEVYDKFKEFADNPFEILSKSIDSKLSDKYAVINHGDCSISNVLFKYDDLENPNVPSHLCFLDWQMTRLGSPVLDLTCFIFSCTDMVFRDKYYNEVIDEYYTSLSGFLKELGSDVDQVLPLNILTEQFQRYSIFGLYMSILLIYFQNSNNEDIPDLTRISPDEVANGHIYSLAKTNEFHKRVRSVICDFNKFGYLK